MPHLDVAPVIGSVTGIFLRDINQREGIFVGVLNETGGSRRGGERGRPVDADRTCRFRGGRGRRLGRTELNCGSVPGCVAACVVERSSSMD